MRRSTLICALLALCLAAMLVMGCTGDPGCVQVADEHPSHCIDP